MKRVIIIVAGMILFSNLSIAAAPAKSSIPSVEYVSICNYGNGYYYIPAYIAPTSPCLAETTGATVNILPDGSTVTGQSFLAYRISQLEKQIAMLENESQ